MLPFLKKLFPKHTDEICCVSTGRTGTNFLFGKIKGCKRLLVHYEIFNPLQSYVDWDARDLIQDKKSLSQKALDKMARTDKGRLLGLLREARDDLGRSCMIYKVFPTSSQLTMKELEKLIIRRRRVGVVMIVRNPLNVFLSICKAKQVRSFGQVNTTSIKVELPPVELINFIHRSTQVYKSTIESCEKHRTPFATVSYETVFQDPNNQAPIDILLERLNSFMKPPLHLSVNPDSDYIKQDNSELAESIVNFNEVTASLEKEGLGSLLSNSTEYQSALALHET